MRKLLFFVVLVFSYNILHGQSGQGNSNSSQSGELSGAGAKGNGRISGLVMDSTNQKPVPFATVALLDFNSGKPLDGAICEDNGKFSLTKIKIGQYKVAISFLGYQTKNIGEVKISDRNEEIDLGTIKISQSIQLLKEVTIEGQKALFEEKVDRMVYNAENDATNKGGDATDVLRKVPMLSVDLDGNISLRGSQSIKVLINNKPSTIAANSVADALKQIPADLIKSVEVITSPSAKYDAEGSAGIINIITKKNNLQGFSLGVDASGGIRGSNLGLNGSYRKGKMGFSLGGFGRVGYNINGSFQNHQETSRPTSSTNLTINDQNADTRTQYGFGQYQLGWDYDLNDNNSITSSVRYGFRNNETFQDKLLTLSSENESLINSSIRDINVEDLSGTLDINLNYTHTFKKPQREFSLLSLYSRNNRTNDFINNILDDNDLSISRRLKNQNESFNQEITVQADFQTPIGKTQMIEVGVKDIIRHVSSDFRYLSATGSDGPYEVSSNQQLANIFNYDQNVTAGYFSYTLNFLSTFSIKPGLRYEYTTINAHFQDGQDIQIPSYGVFVPSINISKKLANGNSLKASYNRRIQRPSLQFLNPNLQASNPLNATIGNPNLEPEYTDNYELSYSAYFNTSSVSLSTFMRNTRNSIQGVRELLGEDTIKTTYENIGQEDAYGFSLFGNVKLFNKLSLNGGTDVYYAILNNNVSNPLYNASNEGWVASFRAFGSYTLPKGWGLQMFAFYRARQVQLQGFQGGFGIYSLSVRKDFKNKKGSIGFGAENFFTPSYKIRNELTSPSINQYSTNELRLMNFKINFSYRIGKMNVDERPRKRRKSINNDDLKDGGDSNPAGGGGQPQGSNQGQAPAQQGTGGPPKQAPAKAPGQGSPAAPTGNPNVK